MCSKTGGVSRPLLLDNLAHTGVIAAHGLHSRPLALHPAPGMDATPMAACVVAFSRRTTFARLRGPSVSTGAAVQAPVENIKQGVAVAQRGDDIVGANQHRDDIRVFRRGSRHAAQKAIIGPVIVDPRVDQANIQRAQPLGEDIEL